MIPYYDSAGEKHPLTQYEDFCIVHEQDGFEDCLQFSLDPKSADYQYIEEEGRIVYGGNNWLVKKINDESIECYINFNFLKENVFAAYYSESLTLSALMRSLLPADYSILNANITSTRRTIEKDYATPYEILKQAMSTYDVYFEWQTAEKTVTVHSASAMTSSGEYISDELNLKTLSFCGDTTNFATRLYPYGKDGMTIADVNNGKEYVENHTFSNEIVCAYWVDERYTIAENLKNDAQEKLDAMAVPVRTYECDVDDLAKSAPDKYAFLAFILHRVITLIDHSRSLRVDHKIVQYKEYPEEPSRNKVTLSSVQQDISSYMKAAISDYNEEQLSKGEQDWMNEQIMIATALLTNAAGTYPFTDEDGNFYLADNENLSEAQNVWIFNKNGMGHSSTGVEGPYNTSWTFDAKFIADLVYAMTICADRIKTGAISVADDNGNIIFQADMDTKSVIISGDHVRIAGQSATEAIEGALSAAQDAKSLNIILSNEYQGIPTDEDGNYTTFPDCSTAVTLLQGSTDVSASATYSIKTSSGVTATWNNSARTCTVTGMTADSGYVEITATYSGTKVSKKFTLAKQKQGLQGSSGYVVVLENDSQSFSANSNGQIISSGAIEIPFRGFYGAKQVACTCTVDESSLPSFIALDYVDEATESDKGAVYLNLVQFEFVGTTFSGTIQLDFLVGTQTVTKYFGWSIAVSGSSGTSARIYIIEPSVYTITKDNSSTLAPASVTFKAKYRTGTSTSTYTYSGRFKIEESTNGTTYTTKYTSTANQSSYTYTLSSSDVMMVRCTLYAAGGTTTVLDTQTVAVLSDGTDGRVYFVETSANSIIYDPASGTYSPSSITFKSYYRDGNGSKIENPASIQVTWDTPSGGWDLHLTTELETSYTQAISSGLASTKGAYITCNIKDGSTLLDSVTIPCIQNGAKGEDGADAADMTAEELFNKLTDNGTIQGLFMKNGQIYVNATYIKSGTLLADLIKGGTLKLGGASNTYGSLSVLDASGNTIGTWNKDGINITKGSFYNQTGESGVSIYNGQMRTTYSNVNIGYIGTNKYSGTSCYGMDLAVNYSGDYFALSCQDSSGGDYITKLLYANSTFSGYSRGRMYLGCDLDYQNYTIRNAKIDNLVSINGYSPYSGSIPVITKIVNNGNGSITWTSSSITVKDGIITAAPS